MAKPGAHPLADADRDKKIADRDATFGGGESVQRWGREHSWVFPVVAARPIFGLFRRV
jgi:hypothetical protein